MPARRSFMDLRTMSSDAGVESEVVLWRLCFGGLRLNEPDRAQATLELESDST